MIYDRKPSEIGACSMHLSTVIGLLCAVLDEEAQDSILSTRCLVIVFMEVDTCTFLSMFCYVGRVDALFLGSTLLEYTIKFLGSMLLLIYTREGSYIEFHIRKQVSWKEKVS